MLPRRNSAKMRSRRSTYSLLTASIFGPPVAAAVIRLRCLSISVISSSSVQACRLTELGLPMGIAEITRSARTINAPIITRMMSTSKRLRTAFCS